MASICGISHLDHYIMRKNVVAPEMVSVGCPKIKLLDYNVGMVVFVVLLMDPGGTPDWDEESGVLPVVDAHVRVRRFCHCDAEQAAALLQQLA